MDYAVVPTYLKRNQTDTGKEDAKAGNKKPLADGPVFTISKSKRIDIMKGPSFGKDGKEPPHSYMNLRTWFVKKDKKEIADKPKVNRKTYIDEVIDYTAKHKYPGPDAYFKEKPKKKEKDVDKKVDGKKLQRPCYLDEYQYLGMNLPAPGSYNLDVFF